MASTNPKKSTAKKMNRKAPVKAPRKSKTVSKKTTAKAPKLSELEPQILLRPYQQEAQQAFDDGRRRQVLIWHRRAGKDFFGMQMARREMIKTPATYWHMFPKHSQARRAIWTGIDSRLNKRFIDLAFGDLYTSKPNNTDMFIEMDNGASWQLLGSDNYNRHVGSNPLGVVISEWALCDPRAWAYIRPIIRENGGWVLFITTYRGRNHAYQMAQQLQGNENWYVNISTIEDTFKSDGSRIITNEDIEEEREEGMSEAMIQQEYYCNPVAVMEGAIYGSAIIYMEKTNKITNLNYDPMRPTWCLWSYLDYPVSISCVVFQPNIDGGADILFAENYYFKDSTDVFSDFNNSTLYPIAKHIIYGAEDSNDVIEQATAFGFSPDIVLEQKEISLITKTSLWLRMSRIDSRQNVLLDSLRSFKIKADFIEEDFDAEDSVGYLVKCCEGAAVYQDSTKWNRQQWNTGRTYKASDRMAI